jgi:prepilin-type N-terminal cleavage/methylation domain-containing protein
MRPRCRLGFTFVEMMVVVGLFSVVGVALFTSFSMGLKVWKSAASPNIGQRRALLALERCAQELRQLSPSLAILAGEPLSCSFPLIARDRLENVTYAFDLRTGVFSREAALFEGDMEAGGSSLVKRVLVTGVKDGNFSYFDFEAASGGSAGNGTYFESWNATQIFPKAVRVEMELEDGTRVEKIIVIPSAW